MNKSMKQNHKTGPKTVVQEIVQEAMRKTADVHTVEERFYDTMIELARHTLAQKNPSDETLLAISNILGYGTTLLHISYGSTQKRRNQQCQALKKAFFAMLNPDHVQPSKKTKF